MSQSYQGPALLKLAFWQHKDLDIGMKVRLSLNTYGLISQMGSIMAHAAVVLEALPFLVSNVMGGEGESLGAGRAASGESQQHQRAPRS